MSPPQQLPRTPTKFSAYPMHISTPEKVPSMYAIGGSQHWAEPIKVQPWAEPMKVQAAPAKANFVISPPPGLCSVGAIHGAPDPRQYSELQGVPGPRHYNEVLSKLAKVGDVPGSVAIVNQMMQRGMQLHRTTLNSVITACASSGRALEAEHWLGQLRKLKHVPNRATYCSLIIAWAKAGDLNKAEAWVQRLHDDGFRIPKSLNRPIIHTLLDSNTVKNPSESNEDISRIDRAANWLYRIHDLGAPLESSTLNLVMFAYARSGNLDKTENCATFMMKNNIPPNHSTFCALVTASVVAGDMERAKLWGTRMQQLGFERVDADTIVQEIAEQRDGGDVSTNSDHDGPDGDFDDFEDIAESAVSGARAGAISPVPTSLRSVITSYALP